MSDGISGEVRCTDCDTVLKVVRCTSQYSRYCGGWEAVCESCDRVIGGADTKAGVQNKLKGYYALHFHTLLSRSTDWLGKVQKAFQRYPEFSSRLGSRVCEAKLVLEQAKRDLEEDL